MSDHFLQSLSASDIANLAGVSRGAVSNWRRRHDDFPKPIKDAEGVEFDAREVREWLTSYGYEIKTPDADDLLWSIAIAVRDQLETTPFSHLVTALFAVRKHEQKPLAETKIEVAFSKVSAQLGLEYPDQFVKSLAALEESGRFDEVQAVIDSIPVEDFGEVADKLLERRGFGRSFEASGLNPASSRVLARAVGQLPENATVLDLACGRAGTLFDVAAKQDSPAKLYGSDVFETSLNVARLRAYLHEIPATLKSADVLNEDPFPGLKADAVVIEAPFGMRHEFDRAIADPRWLVPPRSISTDIAWVQLAASYLSDGGRGYVLTSTVPLFKSGAIQHTRVELVRSGLVEAIVALPRGLAEGTSIATVVWILSRNSTRDQILFIDATDEDADEIEIAKWLADPESAPKSQSVPVRELLAGDVNLNPQMWVIPEPDVVDQAEQIESSTRDLADALESLAARKAPTLVKDLPKAPMVSLGTLEERHYLKIRATRNRNRKDEAVLSSTDLSARIIDVKFAADRDLEVGVSGPLPRIVLSTQGGISAAVDEVGIARMSPLVHILEVDATRLDPYYLATLLMSTSNTRFLQGASMRSARVSDLEIPLLPLDLQQKVARSIKDGWKLQRILRSADASVTELLNSYVDFAVESTSPR